MYNQQEAPLIARVTNILVFTHFSKGTLDRGQMSAKSETAGYTDARATKTRQGLLTLVVYKEAMSQSFASANRRFYG